MTQARLLVLLQRVVSRVSTSAPSAICETLQATHPQQFGAALNRVFSSQSQLTCAALRNKQVHYLLWDRTCDSKNTLHLARQFLGKRLTTAALSPDVATSNVIAASSLRAWRTVAGSLEGVPSRTRTALAAWLGLTGAWVYSMVVLGGVTRLTRSGLSMTEWKLTGERAPSTDAEWHAEFEKYRLSPEFLKVHRSMTVDDFKFIYWMEYAHRMWGRMLGIAFAVPAAYFVVRGQVTAPLGRRLALLLFMGGTQGLVGWWMVRSGLQEQTDQYQVPRVSPYRLAAHLVSAFAIFATLTWTTLDVMHPRPAVSALGADTAALASTAAARRLALPLTALLAITAMSGAFVAGLDAGRAYNTFPLMAGHLVPQEYVSPALPWTRNLFENTAAVQFNHRLLATLTATGIGALWLTLRSAPLPPRARTCLHVLAGLTAGQYLLGVMTLLHAVPPTLGSLHQANALNLFAASLALLHALRPMAHGPVFRTVGPWVTPVAAVMVGSVGYSVVQANGVLLESKPYQGPATA